MNSIITYLLGEIQYQNDQIRWLVLLSLNLFLSDNGLMMTHTLKNINNSRPTNFRLSRLLLNIIGCSFSSTTNGSTRKKLDPYRIDQESPFLKTPSAYAVAHCITTFTTTMAEKVSILY